MNWRGLVALGSFLTASFVASCRDADDLLKLLRLPVPICKEIFAFIRDHHQLVLAFVFEFAEIVGKLIEQRDASDHGFDCTTGNEFGTIKHRSREIGHRISCFESSIVSISPRAITQDEWSAFGFAEVRHVRSEHNQQIELLALSMTVAIHHGQDSPRYALQVPVIAGKLATVRSSS